VSRTWIGEKQEWAVRNAATARPRVNLDGNLLASDFSVQTATLMQAAK